jgi:hypothetical protein
MSYCLQDGEAFAHDIWRIAYEQIDEALAHLGQRIDAEKPKRFVERLEQY